jgi:hypothetical protein
MDGIKDGWMLPLADMLHEESVLLLPPAALHSFFK